MTETTQSNLCALHRLIIGQVAEDLLKAGFSITVFTDSRFEETGKPVKTRATDFDTVMKAAADEEWYIGRVQFDCHPANAKAASGFVAFVLGNDVDVLADYSTNLEAYTTRATATAESYQKAVKADPIPLLLALQAIVTPTGFANLDAGAHGTHGAALRAIAQAMGVQ